MLWYIVGCSIGIMVKKMEPFRVQGLGFGVLDVKIGSAVLT